MFFGDEFVTRLQEHPSDVIMLVYPLREILIILTRRGTNLCRCIICAESYGHPIGGMGCDVPFE